MSRPSQVERSRIAREAAGWVVRQADAGFGAADRQALAEWAARSDEHAASLARARRSWAALGQLAGQADGLLAERPGPARRRPVLAALAAAVVLALGLATWQLGWPGVAGPAPLRSARAEVRRVVLPDGSQVTLAPDSAIAPRFGTELRQVELLAGEALFAPAPTDARERRPFVVVAGNGSTRALGTRFTVALRENGADVAVLEHTVEVSLADASVRLQPAQQVRYGAAGLQRPRAVDAERGAGWVEGRLVFDRLTLADVVAVLNRYRAQPVVVLGPGLRGRLVSGAFRADALDGALQTVAAETGATVLDLPLPFALGRTVLY